MNVMVDGVGVSMTQAAGALLTVGGLVAAFSAWLHSRFATKNALDAEARRVAALESKQGEIARDVSYVRGFLEGQDKKP